MASVKVKLKKDKILSDNSHPIVIQVIHNRKRKVFYLGYSSTEKQWDYETKLPTKKHPEHKLIKSKVENAVLDIKSIILDFEIKNKNFH